MVVVAGEEDEAVGQAGDADREGGFPYFFIKQQSIR